MKIPYLPASWRNPLMTLLLSVVLGAGGLCAEDLVWIEGEDAAESNAQEHPWFSRSIKAEELSGGKFLSHMAKDKTAEALYRFEVKKAGAYTFWARLNATAGPKVAFDLNGKGWQDMDLSAPLDTRNLAADGKPDMRYISWINAGSAELPEGKNTIRFRFSSPNSNHGSLDCFMFTQGAFTPNGRMKPGEKLGLTDKGMWAFEPDADEFSEKAMLDLSYLNTPIGKNDPFISVDKNGDFGKGADPIRFWAINSNAQRNSSHAELIQHGRWLAKRGVNLVRWHGHLPTDKQKKDTTLDAVNDQALDECFKLVAAMRENGIYTCLSPYWGTHTKNKKSWGLSHIENDSLTAVVFWDKRVQEAYKGYLRTLYTTVNPYTGIALRDDPAVAIIQLQNEDSILFWTMQRVKGEVLKDLQRLFAAFAVKKYGALDKAVAAWDNYRHKEDNVAQGILGLDTIWELTQSRKAGHEKRKSDQFEFFVTLMRDFNAQMANFLRDELGCKQIINAGNWRTASDETMLDAERYSYAINEVIGANRYKSVLHTGPRSGHMIQPDDLFTNSSVLRNPHLLPVALKQVRGRATIIPESSWVPPERYQAEGPLLTAAYSSLTGVDSLIWFCHGAREWEMPLGKWSVGTPMQLGQFPAAALIFRKDYVKRGTPAVSEKRTLDSLWRREASLITEGQAYDPNRDEIAANTKADKFDRINPLAFLVGPVEVDFGNDGGQNTVPPLDKYIDTKAQTVRSNTGELFLDYGRGIFTLDAPQAQAATGWLSQHERITLTDIEIASKNEYSSICVVSLDAKPLRTSGNILIQIGTVCRPYGFTKVNTAIKQKNGPDVAGFRITNTGQYLWNVQKTQATVTLNNSALKRAYVLDANGMVVKDFALEKSGAGRVKIALPEDALYLILK